jgi:hypothetical protein
MLDNIISYKLLNLKLIHSVSNDNNSNNSNSRNLFDDDDIYGDQQRQDAAIDSNLNSNVPSDEDDNTSIHSVQQQSNHSISIKRGRSVNERFPLPPKGALQHPFRGWKIDKVAMEEYMRNWSKQEGFAVSKDTRKNVIYWRCVHAGKYRNRRGLPSEVTEDSKRQEMIDSGIIKLISELMNRTSISAAKRFNYKTGLSILCGFYSDEFR